MTKYIAAALLLAAVAAPAFAGNNDACLMRRYIDGWGARNDHSMVVNDRFGRKYLLNLTGVCDDINFAMGVGIRSLGGAPDTCVERGDHIIMRGGGAFPHSTCWVSKIQVYTPEMEKADREARATHQPMPTY